MTNLQNMLEEFKFRSGQLDGSVTMSDDGYFMCLYIGLRQMYVKTGRPTLFVETKLAYDEHQLPETWEDSLPPDEYELTILLGLLQFYGIVLASKAPKAIGYTTDAFSVTGADKPAKYYESMLTRLEHDVYVVYNKMIRYTMQE